MHSAAAPRLAHTHLLCRRRTLADAVTLTPSLYHCTAGGGVPVVRHTSRSLRRVRAVTSRRPHTSGGFTAKQQEKDFFKIKSVSARRARCPAARTVGALLSRLSVFES